MISFIIIGKNVEVTIRKCIESILTLIDLNKIKDWEIIYSDSDSNDNSLKIAMNYPVRLVKLKGDLNAAIARNQGANIARGNILFFIDGDMELLQCAYNTLFINEKTLRIAFITASHFDKYYSDNYLKEIENYDYAEIASKDENNAGLTRSFTGGLFAIQKNLWDKMKGMDEKLDVNEDIDFGLRMAKFGIKQFYYPYKIIAIHHTIDYYDPKRILSFILTNKLLFTGTLIRKSLNNVHFLKLIIRSRYSLFLFVCSLMFIPFSINISMFLGILYFSLQLLRSLAKRKHNFLFHVYIYLIIYDLYSIFGFLFFYPKIKKYSFEILQ
jgi:glycosyltransferase involved in cell wall biosynthesis